ncbi:MAG: transketolase family protein [Candidatus Eisenbacteria bacterium]|uniref:Transketolase family protein n=1 Tax=Eiseniibacteriota bacterium TaxID=2212470 RepID=A0A849SGF9_UNCEI|nr:transketolase family protein [Candidatus Eisenbacteria bacterium]
MKKTREGFGRALVDLGEQDPRIVVMVGDLSESTMVHFFAERFPERFIQVGIAEQNMMCVAAGLAAVGKIPFLATYGAFASCRSADQMRVSVAYTNLPVKIAGAHGGISVGPDGATHQAMEEISIVRSIPHMSIVVPCDFWETYKATMAIAHTPGPVYLRFGREDVPVVTEKDTPFTFGKGEVFAPGSDLTIVACGVMVYEALRAHEQLAGRGISARVVDLHTPKPLDRELLIRCARETGAIVTAEEHQVNGGLGGAVAETIVQNHPVPMEFVAVHDRFGQSGKPAELMDAFGLRAKDIVEAAERVLTRKRGR